MKLSILKVRIQYYRIKAFVCGCIANVCDALIGEA